MVLILKSALENNLTAKPLRAQRNYRKNKSHQLGLISVVVDRSDLECNPY
jgi:hypothetical protein